MEKSFHYLGIINPDERIPSARPQDQVYQREWLEVTAEADAAFPRILGYAMQPAEIPGQKEHQFVRFSSVTFF